MTFVKKTALSLIATALFATSSFAAEQSQYQHIRNATAKIEYAGKTFLVDPYLAEKDRYLPPNAKKT
ncbi:Uncharacterised protein [Mannheimia haemolytica]|nr:Uncharacterised protein [Mannheimia haemolytica]